MIGRVWKFLKRKKQILGLGGPGGPGGGGGFGYTMCLADNATAGRWAGVGLVNRDLDLLRYWRDI
jgi:hypothetical protein